MHRDPGSSARRGYACISRGRAPARRSARSGRARHCRRTPRLARRRPPSPPGLPRVAGPGYRLSCCSSSSSKAEVGCRIPLYKMRGNAAVTENVTWLSPVTCDPVKARRADAPRGTGSSGRAMRVLVTEDDEVLAAAVAAGLRREGMAVDVALDGGAALERLAVNRY